MGLAMAVKQVWDRVSGTQGAIQSGAAEVSERKTLATPLTYAVIGWLKKAEGVDTFDRARDFNPFRFGR